MYDEVGNTDWYCTEFDIEAQCTIHYYYLSLVLASWNTNPPLSTNPADIMNNIRMLLLKPRQALQVNVGGVNLIPIQDYSVGTVDSQNGPFPQYCDIIQMTNTSFLVSYRITARYWEKPSPKVTAPSNHPQVPGSDVLYNRWTEGVDIDDVDMAMYSRRGTFRIRSDNSDGFIADQLRKQFACVSVPDGFLRHKSHYEPSADGLSLNYEVSFIEAFRKPPNPAYKASAKYKESTGQGGAYRIGEAHVHLVGGKTTPQWQLIYTAIRIGHAYVQFRGKVLAIQNDAIIPFVDATGIVLVESADMEFDWYESNSVDFHIRALISNGPKRLQGLGAFMDMQTGIPLNDSTYVPPYAVYGSSNLLLQAAAYYDPNASTAATQLGSPTNAASAANNFVPTITANQTGGKQPGQAGRLGN